MAMIRAMQFDPPLHHGRLIKRYKRFLADVELDDGETVTAHCPNSGSMMGLCDEGAEVWLSHNPSPTRKLPYGWELVRAGDGLVGIHTGSTNALVAEALEAGIIKELASCTEIRREVTVGGSRLDFRLDGPDGPCFMEVKSVTLRRGDGPAEFPDAVTARGAKHLDELATLARSGQRALMLYVVQRTDCTSFRLAADIDPTYSARFRHAIADGVEVLCYGCQITEAGISVTHPLPIEM